VLCCACRLGLGRVAGAEEDTGPSSEPVGTRKMMGSICTHKSPTQGPVKLCHVSTRPILRFEPQFPTGLVKYSNPPGKDIANSRQRTCKKKKKTVRKKHVKKKLPPTETPISLAVPIHGPGQHAVAARLECWPFSFFESFFCSVFYRI
jgi:hypothetical protein